MPRKGAGDFQRLLHNIRKNKCFTNSIKITNHDYNASDVDVDALAEALRKSTTVSCLIVSGIAIGDRGAQVLAQAAIGRVEKCAHRRLKIVEFERCEVGNDGATALAEVIIGGNVSNDRLKLNLRCNMVGDEGATNLGKALVASDRLVELNLEGNKIGDAGGASLLSSLRTNTGLRILRLGSNRLGSDGLRPLPEALAHNETLMELYLNMNKIGDGGATFAAGALRLDPSLNWLDLEGNRHIGDHGSGALIGALVTNTHLRGLNLEGMRIQGWAAKHLVLSLLMRNHSLTMMGPNIFASVVRWDTSQKAQPHYDEKRIGAMLRAFLRSNRSKADSAARQKMKFALEENPWIIPCLDIDSQEIPYVLALASGAKQLGVMFQIVREIPDVLTNN